MTLVLTDGFETYYDPVQAAQPGGKWNSAGFEFQPSPRTGNNCIRSASLTKQFAPGDENALVVVGFGHRNGYNVNGDLVQLRSDNGATVHCALARKVGNLLAIKVGGVEVAATAGAEISSSWTYLEIRAFLSDVSGTVDVYKNGGSTPILSYSGDTKNGGTKTVFDNVAVLGPSYQVMDDIYIVTGAGAAPLNDRLGEVRCWPLAPNGDGNYSQGVGSDGNSLLNYQLVDENIGNINTADYVGLVNNGDKDTYTYGNLVPTTGTVLNVELASIVSKSDGGTRSIRQIVRTGGIDYPGADVTLGLSAAQITQQNFLNPATGLPWTIGEVNAAEFGVEGRP
jgi:hypothetical protein